MPRKTPAAGCVLPQPILSATALRTPRCLGWLAIIWRRNSSGSLPAALASWSMKVSTHSVLVVDAAPGPRRHVRMRSGSIEGRDGEPILALGPLQHRGPGSDEVAPAGSSATARQSQGRVRGSASQPGQLAVSLALARIRVRSDRLTARARALHRNTGPASIAPRVSASGPASAAWRTGPRRWRVPRIAPCSCSRLPSGRNRAARAARSRAWCGRAPPWPRSA